MQWFKKTNLAHKKDTMQTKKYLFSRLLFLLTIMLVIGCDPTCRYDKTEKASLYNDTKEAITVSFYQCDSCETITQNIGPEIQAEIILHEESKEAIGTQCEDKVETIPIQFKDSTSSMYTICKDQNQVYIIMNKISTCEEGAEEIINR